MRALLAAAFITYMSAAPEDVRQSCLKHWMEMVAVGGFDLRRFLSTESEQLIWKSEGLPSDDLSMENALVILQVSHSRERTRHYCHAPPAGSEMVEWSRLMSLAFYM